MSSFTNDLYKQNTAEKRKDKQNMGSYQNVWGYERIFLFIFFNNRSYLFASDKKPAKFVQNTHLRQW